MLVPALSLFVHFAEIEHHSILILGTLAIIYLDSAWDGNVCQRRKSECVPSVSRGIIECLRVLSDSLIPDHHCPWLVAYSAAEVVSAVDVIEQELEYHILYLESVS